MSERHITPELYHLVGSGALSPRSLARMVHEHVLHHCPECRAAWQALGGDREALARLLDTEPDPGGLAHTRHRGPAGPAPEVPAAHPAAPSTPAASRPQTPGRRRAAAPTATPGSAPPPATPPQHSTGPADEALYTSAFSRVADRLERQAEDLKRVRRQAREDLRELLALEPEARRRRIVNSRTRFRSRALAELLIEESRTRVREDPRLAADLAGLVHHVLLWTPGAVEQEWAAELDLLARARRANALRVAGDLHAADREFAALHQRAGNRPLAPQAAAEMASLEASLRLDQRRFDDAAARLSEAARLFRRAGADEGLARVLVQRGELHRQQGRVPEAIRDLDEALQHLDAERQTYLYLCAAGTLVLALCEGEEYQAARHVLRANAGRFAEVMDVWWALRLRHAEGRVLLGLGDVEGAERVLTETREGYMARESRYDVALISLDLALVFVAQGRTAEIQRLARETAPVFRTLAVGRETLAAVRLFHQAATAERLTGAAVRHLREALERAATHPPDQPTA